jgi:hypothetical protein
MPEATALLMIMPPWLARYVQPALKSIASGLDSEISLRYLAIDLFVTLTLAFYESRL